MVTGQHPPGPNGVLITEDSSVANAHFSSMECESPGGQRAPPPAHQSHRSVVGGNSRHSSSHHSSSSHHHHQQPPPPQQHYPTNQLHNSLAQTANWPGLEAGLSGRGQQVSGGAKPVVMGGVILGQQTASHAYLSRLPPPSSSSTSSSSLHQAGGGMASPSSSTVIIGGPALYEPNSGRHLPNHGLRFDSSQQVLLSSPSSSSLSSSNLPVDLSGLSQFHSATGSNSSLASMGRPVQSLMTSPPMLMGSGIPVGLSVATSSEMFPGQLSGFPTQSTWSQPPGIAGGPPVYPFGQGAQDKPQVNRTHSTAERGDESPMVGVCIQQSPVASH